MGLYQADDAKALQENGMIPDGLLEAVGASETVRTLEGEKFDGHARNSPSFEVSGVRALEILQADPGWRGGNVVHAEVHCMVLPLGIWVDAMIAPLPDRLAALIEFAPSKRGAGRGFLGAPCPPQRYGCHLALNAGASEARDRGGRLSQCRPKHAKRSTAALWLHNF
jgi:hypothetical protein